MGRAQVGALCVLMVAGTAHASDEWHHQIRFGGWSQHLEDEPFEDSPSYNETHQSIGYYYRINQCHGSERWYCQVGGSYLKDSFDNDMYAVSWSWNYPFNDYLAAGIVLGVANRTIAEYQDEIFQGTDRKWLPVFAPKLEFSYRRFSVGLAIFPQVDYLEENGSREYKIGKPTLFWDLAIAF
ncbi:hypothetical protein KUW04_09105 [Halomonas denitrificans]|nr:hypothetical protein [Halomonas denitrificans]